MALEEYIQAQNKEKVLNRAARKAKRPWSNNNSKRWIMTISAAQKFENYGPGYRISNLTREGLNQVEENPAVSEKTEP